MCAVEAEERACDMMVSYRMYVILVTVPYVCLFLAFQAHRFLPPSTDTAPPSRFSARKPRDYDVNNPHEKIDDTQNSENIALQHEQQPRFRVRTRTSGNQPDQGVLLASESAHHRASAASSRPSKSSALNTNKSPAESQRDALIESRRRNAPNNVVIDHEHDDKRDMIATSHRKEHTVGGGGRAGGNAYDGDPRVRHQVAELIEISRGGGANGGGADGGGADGGGADGGGADGGGADGGGADGGGADGGGAEGGGADGGGADGGGADGGGADGGGAAEVGQDNRVVAAGRPAETLPGNAVGKSNVDSNKSFNRSANKNMTYAYDRHEEKLSNWAPIDAQSRRFQPTPLSHQQKTATVHSSTQWKTSTRDVITIAEPLQGHCASHAKQHQQPEQLNSSGAHGFQRLRDNYFYSAYLDDRDDAASVHVRIIALIQRRMRPKLFCHFINSDTARYVNYYRRVKSASVRHYEMCENHAKDYGGWILTCKLPAAMTTNAPCQLILSVHTTYDPKRTGNIHMPLYRVSALKDVQKQDFGVCVPPLFGHIPSTTFIEFIELTRLLGASHFLFYARELTTEIEKVLRFYSEQRLVSVMPWPVPVDDKAIWYHGQLLAINDCLYRSMHAFRYVAFNDLDEFIVPQQHANWTQMLAHLHGDGGRHHNDNIAQNQSQYCGYAFQSAFFDPLAPSARVLYDLESDLRTKLFSDVRKKVLIMPERIHELGIHHISKPTSTALQTYEVAPPVAFVHHYRQCLTEFDHKMRCNTFTHDASLSRFIPYLRHNVHRVTWLLKERETHRDRDGSKNNRDI